MATSSAIVMLMMAAGALARFPLLSPLVVPFFLFSASQGLLFTGVLSRMTLSEEGLSVRAGARHHRWQWASIREVRLSRRAPLDQVIIAHFTDGTTSKPVQLAYWMTRGPSQWPSDVLRQIDTHGIRISDGDRRVLTEEFINRRSIDKRAKVNDSACSRRIYNAYPPRTVRISIILGFALVALLLCLLAMDRKADPVAGAVVSCLFLALPGVLALAYTPVLSRLTISDDVMVVRSWGQTITVPWGDVTALTFTEPTGAAATNRLNTPAWGTAGLTLRAHYRDGSKSGAITFDTFAHEHATWPRDIIAQVDTHAITMTDDDRHTLLTGYGNLTAGVSQPNPQNPISPWKAIALGAITPAVVSALVVIVRNWG